MLVLVSVYSPKECSSPDSTTLLPFASSLASFASARPTFFTSMPRTDLGSRLISGAASFSPSLLSAALSDQQRGAHDGERLEAQPGQVALELSLHPVVKDHRVGLGAERGDDQEVCCAGGSSSLRKTERIVVVDVAKLRLRARLLDGRAETADGNVRVFCAECCSKVFRNR